MSILKYKYQAHKFVNYIFYIIVFAIGFFLGFAGKNIDFKKIIPNILFIDNVSAFEVEINSSISFDEDFIIEHIPSSAYDNSDFSLENYSYVVVTLHKGTDGYGYSGYFYNAYFIKDFSSAYFRFGNSFGQIIVDNADYFSYTFYLDTNELASYNSFVDRGTINYTHFYQNYNDHKTNFYTNFDIDFIDESDIYDVDSLPFLGVNQLDFTEPVILDAQVNTWNGYGYDFYTNQVGILDMEENTHIVASHTCPNDGSFTSGYFGDTNDICMWSYNNNLSDFLVFYFNGRVYDSINIDWSNITFLQNHKYTLSFTLYGLFSTEQLYSIQFSLEGDLNQEILATDFKQVLYDSIDEKTYLTFTIIPTEDIEFDHFFLKYLSNGSYAQTIGANRLWVYNDYTNLTDEQISIIQTDKLLQNNKGLKDLINDPFTNKPSIENFWDNFNETDFGLSTIVLSPIRAVQKISNGVCTPQTITILNKNIVLPCGDTLFWNRGDVASFKIFWNMFWGGIICYHIGISIFKLIHDYNNPSSDKVEVLDL